MICGVERPWACEWQCDNNSVVLRDVAVGAKWVSDAIVATNRAEGWMHTTAAATQHKKERNGDGDALV